MAVCPVVETVGVRAVVGQDRPQTPSLWPKEFSLQTTLSARRYPQWLICVAGVWRDGL